MRLDRASALGVFATTHIADCHEHTYCQGRDIATSLDVPADYLLKILQKLVKARILESLRGPHGGFRLHDAPDEITILDIVEAINGPLDGKLAPGLEVKGLSNTKRALELACGEAAGFARSLLAKTPISALTESGPAK